MKNFFLASLLLEKVKLVESYDKFCLDLLTGLLCFFKDSSHIISQIAQLLYHKKDHDMSIQVFGELLKRDPYRLDSLDIYSNILYVKDNPKDLGALAANSFANNKYSPETNCIIGNYHSLMGEHEKAITYFKNALTLDRTFLAAWTLIGHEYLELKKVPNAIDAYNHAIKIDSKDFRAWYGLGQAYELQNLMQTSIHYFLMAVKTRPRDYRMWNALATAYQKCDKPQEAIKCSERAENYKDDERIALFNLGKLYDSLGLTEKAVKCFTENLLRIESTPTIENVE
jgi:anaphase-promoting complex subunit 8